LKRARVGRVCFAFWISSWREVDGRPIPGPFGAVWHLPEGPLPYIQGELDPASIAFNVPPTG